MFHIKQLPSTFRSYNTPGLPGALKSDASRGRNPALCSSTCPSTTPGPGRSQRDKYVPFAWWPHLCLGLPKGILSPLPTVLDRVCHGDKRMTPDGKEHCTKEEGEGSTVSVGGCCFPVLTTPQPQCQCTGPRRGVTDHVDRKRGCTMSGGQDSPIRGLCSLGTEYKHKPLLFRCRDFFQNLHSGVCAAEGDSFVWEGERAGRW